MAEKQGWTDGPNSRGSFDILWTCLSTLGLCVWSAVHPNILRVSSARRALLSRLGMMLVAIVFPEIIISSAWKQLRLSQSLRAKVNALSYNQSHKDQARPARLNHPAQGDDPEPHQTLLPAFDFENNLSNVSLRSRETSKSISGIDWERSQSVRRIEKEMKREPIFWSAEHAFFAVMGGFAIENEYISSDNHTKITLRRLVAVDGVLELAKLGLLPTISPEDIEERSKADIIAKVFVLSQITWFGLQVIGRLASKIPVTPIEIHTVIHVACTIAIYLMWLKKPYDVRSSILLNQSKVKDIGALFNFSKIASYLHAQDVTRYESARASYWKHRLVRAASNILDHDSPPMPPVKELLTIAIERYSQLSADEGLTAPRIGHEYILGALAPSAQRGIRILQERAGYSDDYINSRSWDYLRESSENFTIKEVWGGWSTDQGHKMSLDKGVHFAFNLLYGGGHLAAWASSSFPTAVEQWLWRSAAIMLTLVPFWGSLWISWWKAAASKRRELFPIRNGDLDIVVAPFFFVIIMAYLLARAYLLVESLISLRLLPVGAYLTVNWTRYLPHIA